MCGYMWAFNQYFVKYDAHTDLEDTIPMVLMMALFWPITAPLSIFSAPSVILYRKLTKDE